MNRKKYLSCLAAAAAATFMLIGCGSLLKEGGQNQQEYGSIMVTGASDSRIIDYNEIAFAKVSVSGKGIDSSKVKPVEAVVSEGSAKNVTIANVPKGNNRIVTAEALNALKGKVGSVQLKAIVNVLPDQLNPVTVNWESTALGTVFEKLLAKNIDIGAITKDGIDSIKAAIGTETHSTLVDTDLIASDYAAGTLKDSSAYLLKAASLKVDFEADGTYSIQVCDPISTVKENCKGGSAVVEGIAPGSWDVYLLKDGNKVDSKRVAFKSGKESTLSFASITDRIIIHAYDYTHIWTYDDKAGKNYTSTGKWPGDLMEADVAENWYTYTIMDGSSYVSSASVILSKNGSAQTSNGETVNAGEWWYYKSKWYEYDPIDKEIPVIESVVVDKGTTVSGIAKITVNASDNKQLAKASLYISGDGLESEKLLASLKFGELDDSVEYELDTGCYKNGAYAIKVVVQDAYGNNSIESVKNLTFTNENRAPVAFITGSNKVGLGKTATYKGTGSRDDNGSIVSYSWSVTGATIVGNKTDPSISVKFPDSKTSCTISLTVKDDDGATDTTTKEVSVDALTKRDFREETIYFAMTTRFYDGDTSNNVHCWDENEKTPANDPAWRGDFKGLIEKLDYIKALGFTAVWITPVVENCSGMDYHGYHAMNFSKVDPRYESSDVDFQTLIDAVHDRGMKLVLDVVFNHVGNFGEEYLCPMFEKDYTADLADINACLKFHPNSLLPETYWNMKGPEQYATRLNLMKNTDYQNHDTRNYFHHFGFGNWDNFSVQFFQMAGDCVDLNTENPKVLKYIGDAYSKYIEMGVDAFRIDTGKHLSRLEFNYYLNNRFIETAQACGNDGFYMFTEICAKSTDVTYRGNVENLSPYFYTWMDEKDYGFTMDDEDQFEGVIIYPESAQTEKDEQAVLNNLDYWTRDTVDGGKKTPVNALAVQLQGMDTTNVRANRPESNNHLLNGNEYHEPDYSMASGLNVIDFPMHWNFGSAKGAYSVRGGDKFYNDATWNVVYVDSHDYGPGNQFEQRYDGEDIDWAENVNLMFTFRGIPCLYYGSEIGFMKGAIIDKGPIMPLYETGRAYFGDNIEGTVNASDFGEYTATGAVADTLAMPLPKHIQRMNKIRRAIPALQKGQYSTENCGSNEMAFKRRYTADGEDSFVLVTLSGDTTFTNLPAGTYLDVVTGDKKTVAEGGSITTSGCTGKGNARIYVLQNETATDKGANAVIGESTEWLK